MTRRHRRLIGSLLLAALPTMTLALPATQTGRVLDAADGASPARLSWRAWSLADPTAMSSGLPGQEQVGTERRDGFWGQVPDTTGWTDAMRDRTVAVEGHGHFAVTRAALGMPLVNFPATQLAALPQPGGLTVGNNVIVSWTLPTSMGQPPGDAQGLAGWAVERAPAGSSTFAQVGQVTAGETAFTDRYVPGGDWQYATRAIFTAGVRGLELSLPGAPVHVDVWACDEPSSLLVSKGAASMLTLAWVSAAPRSRVYRGTMDALWSSRAYDHGAVGLCDITGSSAPIADVAGGVYFLVIGSCGATESSYGRDSTGRERAAAAPGCP